MVVAPTGLADLIEILNNLPNRQPEVISGCEVVVSDCNLFPPGFAEGKVTEGVNWSGVLAQGARRCSVDESHMVAFVHPRFDGFVSVQLTAHVQVDDICVVIDESLSRIVTPHHRVSGSLLPLLGRGRQLPIDIEIHSHLVPEAGVSGRLEFNDASGARVSNGLTLTLASCRHCECIVVGESMGPWSEATDFRSEIVSALQSPRRMRRLVRKLKKMGWSS